jgi:exosortase A
MITTVNNDNSHHHKKLALAFVVTLLVWLVLIFDSMWSAIQIWIGNEIYNHCLIVIPASIYLIYEKRFQLDWASAKMSWLALLAFIGQLFIYIIGGAADIQLFQHIAVFSMLPTLVWLFVGDKIAWSIKFPLAFVLFAVPVGEELIPFLQEITADMSVFMLEMTGIPLYRSGLFIEIPQGKFLVAEACSGVSFLIASIVLGNLYAYMNLVSWQRRVLFFCLSIIFPILANAVRVYGIIFIGYSSNMEHAVGADHLIYGWFFFALVLVCLFILGEFIRKNEVKKLAAKASQSEVDEAKSDAPAKNAAHHTPMPGKKALVPSILLVVLASMGLVKYQMHTMQSIDSFSTLEMNIDFSGLKEVKHSHRLGWEPRYVGNSHEAKYHLSNGQVAFDLYYAYYNGEENEVVSSLNRPYEQERWTLVQSSRDTVNGIPIQRQLITSSLSIQKQLAFWYVVDGQIASDFKEVKLLQLLQKLKGKQSHSFIVMIALEINPELPYDNDAIMEVVSDFIEQERLVLN